jgi:hypothetical protein
MCMPPICSLMVDVLQNEGLSKYVITKNDKYLKNRLHLQSSKIIAIQLIYIVNSNMSFLP